VLFLIADTGGGHRAAAEAVIGALRRRYPGTFDPVLCDPVGGPRAAWLLRWLTGLYGPTIRWVPLLWGAVFYATNTRLAAALLRSTLLRLANRPVIEAVERVRPAAIVSLHPLTVRAAVAARDHAGSHIPVMTVVTDLINPHVTWLDDGADRVVVPASAADWPRSPGRLEADRRIEAGPPVAAGFAVGPPRLSEREELRRSLGLGKGRFVVVLSGGGEGSGGMARRAGGILRRTEDVSVVALCGRSARLERKLSSLAARSGGRLIVKGFVANMADWLRCADVVAGKAGPGTITEAGCCGSALVLTSHLPGQEHGNIEFVVQAGAGRYARTVRSLIGEVERLRDDRAAIVRMRLASLRLARPDAADRIAAELAALAGVAPPVASARVAADSHHGSRVARYPNPNVAEGRADAR
jgi:1,2-diacylglycerol 3-beta-galactosyltransferase